MPKISFGACCRVLLLLAGLSGTVMGRTDLTRPVREFSFPAVTTAAFMPDGKTVLTARGKRVYFEDVASGAVLRALADHGGDVTSISVKPDSQLIATGCADGLVRVFGASDGRLLNAFATGATGATGAMQVAFSPVGHSLLASGPGGTVYCYDVYTGALTTTLTGHAAGALAWSPDGQSIATAGDDTIARLWDAKTGKLLRELPGHMSKVNDVAFSPHGGRLLTASGDGDQTVRMWDTTNGKVIRTLTGHTAGVNTAVFSPDGELVLTVSSDATARLWNGDTGAQVRVIGIQNHSDNTQALFTPDGKQALVLTGIEFNGNRFWEVATGNMGHKLAAPMESVSSVVFSADGWQALVGGSDGLVWLLAMNLSAMNTLLPVRTFIDPAQRDSMVSVVDVAFSPDGQQVAAEFSDGQVRLWKKETGELRLTLQMPASSPIHLNFSPDGTRIAAISQNTLFGWNVASGQLLYSTPIVYEYPLRAFAFSPDGNKLFVGGGEHSNLYSATTGALLKNADMGLDNNSVPVLAATFSPDGKTIYGAGNRTASIYRFDIASGKVASEFSLGDILKRSLALSRDGSRLLFGGGFKVTLYDPATGSLLRDFKGFTSWMSSSDLSPNGRWALAGIRSSVLLWYTQGTDPVNVVSPANGIAQSVNKTVPVHWINDLAQAGSAVRIELWQGGRRVADLGSGYNAEGEGTTPVVLPVVPFVSGYRIRVISAWNSALYADSDPFAILGGPAQASVAPAAWGLYD